MNASPVVPLPDRTSRTPFGGLPALARFNVLLLAALLAALTVLLWPHWRDNPDLSHGFLVPLIFLLLLREARAGTQRYVSGGISSQSAQYLFLALGILVLCASGLYAAALDWSHSLVAFTLTTAIALVLAGALVAFASSRLRIVPLNWTSVVAIAVWLLSAPIPPGSYSRLTLGLQLAVTENVLRALHVLGIAAQRHGNVIELASVSVGVEEACSGVRSLISCIFAGVFFSATLVRKPWARALIVGLAAPIAIAMNFLRSLTLTLLASSGVDISGRWHDVTGFAVLGVTAAILVGLALLLEALDKKRRASARRSIEAKAARPLSSVESATPPTDDESRAHQPGARPRRSISRSAFQKPLATALVLASALAGFFFANTRPSTRQNLPIPDLLAVLPSETDGWQVYTATDLFQFSATLKTEHLAQRTYVRATPDGPEQVTIYLAYWPAGQAPVSLVASHTPDACWPGSGWIAVPLRQSPALVPVGNRPVARPESRLFLSGQLPQYVWFWHLYDGRPIAYRDPRSVRELLKIAWRYGFSHEGDQLFVRISSNRPWTDLAGEPLFATVFSRLQPLGL